MKPSVIHQAQDKLQSSSHHFGRVVRFDYADGVLTLQGKVPSFYLKQRAQALIQGITGVERIDNELLVVSPYGISSEPAIA